MSEAARGGVRFAPSPTGAFHVGNLRTAWVSGELARALGMDWVVRFEDIDEPRRVPGAQERQLHDMRELGLVASEVLVQSQFIARHRSVFEAALRSGEIYPCFCSRKEIREALGDAASAPHGDPPSYNGRCRELERTPACALPTIAWRLRAAESDGRNDVIVARTAPPAAGLSLPLAEGAAIAGTFVPAYHWACAIDDLDGGYDLLVRAHDLAPAAKAQRAIQALVAKLEAGHPKGPETGKVLRFPAIFHCSLVVENDGHRLEKRTQGVTLLELRGRGIGAEELLERFRESFDAKLAQEYRPARIWGESAQTLALSAVTGP